MCFKTLLIFLQPKVKRTGEGSGKSIFWKRKIIQRELPLEKRDAVFERFF
jgi:hypothetical protein